MNMLPAAEDALRDQLAGTQGKETYVFSDAWGGPLDLTNIRHRRRQTGKAVRKPSLKHQRGYTVWCNPFIY